MFTQEMIFHLRSKVHTYFDLPRLVQQLKRIGITSYETFVTDFTTCYKGNTANEVVVPGTSSYTISNDTDTHILRDALFAYKQNLISGKDFYDSLARAGVHSFVVDTVNLYIEYYDKKHELLVHTTLPDVSQF